MNELDELLAVLLGVAFDLLAPERGAILLCETEEDDPRVAIAHPESEEPFGSRTLVRRAIRRRETIVVTDIEMDERLRVAPSVQAEAIRAAVCSPLVIHDQVLGAIYLDTRLESLGARREEIGLLNLIACYAASAIENAVLVRERVRARTLQDLDEEPLVSRSPAMADFVARLESRSDERSPVLIEGEAGTGKLLAARHLHLSGRGRGAPFLALDCRRLSARDMRVVLFGSETPTRPGEPRGGAWQGTAGGTLVLEHIGDLDLLGQATLVELLEESMSDDFVAGPRLVATTSAELARLSRDRGFSERLARILDGDRLAVPRLKDRREDIEVLARHFLRRVSEERGIPEPEFGESALKTLGAGRYREANVRELREAIELAAVLSDGGAIESEHVFTGSRAREHRVEFDLGASRFVQWLSRRRVQMTLGTAVTFVFLGLALVCIAVPSTPAGRFANSLVWSIWWPALLVVFVTVGRLWCTWCPCPRSRAGSSDAGPPSVGHRPGPRTGRAGSWPVCSC